MTLVILSYFNFYVSKEQKVKAKKHYDENDACVIKIQTHVSKKWYFVLSIIALIILWGKFLRTNFSAVVDEIFSDNTLNTIVITSLIILIFVISVIVLFIAPFFGATKAIEYYKQYYLHTFGVMVDI